VIDIRDFGATCGGVADDTAAIAAALAQADAGPDKTVYLPGTPVISAPLRPMPFVTMVGDYATRATDIEYGPRLIASASFQGAAMILMTEDMAGGGRVSFGQTFERLTLDGTRAKSRATFSGIRADGIVRGARLRDVSIRNVSDRGVHGAPVNGRGPYSWQFDNVQVIHPGVDGFRLTGMTDATFTGCRAIGAKRHGWWIDGCANSTWSQCRAEWCGGEGWNITGGWGSGIGAGGGVWQCCSTDRSGRNGFLVAASGTPPLIFSNIMNRRDGRNGGLGGGGFSGFLVKDSTCPVVVGFLSVYPGVDDDGGAVNSPQYGARRINSPYARLTSGFLHAAEFPWADDMSPVWVDGSVGRASGTTDNPFRS
jgi:hypothetical protein